MWGNHDNFFHENGGQLFRRRLDEQLSKSPLTFRIFTAEELHRATDGYSESRVIGPGSNADSIVYKGLLAAGENNAVHHIVAVKKWRFFGELHIERFINELVTLSKLPTEKQIVRIVGAGSDDTPVPVVVYEYMANGTLHRHIHDLHGSMSWEARLRIAAMTAEALSCLHSAIPNPQFHRGLKMKDILLDEGMMPKVSDYGARLMMVGCFTFLRIKKDREGYLSPDFQRGAAEVGDVYSFGVVMAELLTGESPVSSEGVELGRWFGEGVAEGRLAEMLESRVKREAAGNWMVVEAAAEMARRCLMVKGEERPAMRALAEELRCLVRKLNGEEDGGERAAPPS